jgi:hypothetical protein
MAWSDSPTSLCQNNEKTKINASEAFHISYFLILIILEIEEFQPPEVDKFCINTHFKE